MVCSEKVQGVSIVHILTVLYYLCYVCGHPSLFKSIYYFGAFPSLQVLPPHIEGRIHFSASLAASAQAWDQSVVHILDLHFEESHIRKQTPCWIHFLGRVAAKVYQFHRQCWWRFRYIVCSGARLKWGQLRCLPSATCHEPSLEPHDVVCVMFYTLWLTERFSRLPHVL